MKNNRALGVTSDSRKVISMSLYGKDPRYTWGVLRNAQLIPVYLPEWTLRVYVAAGAAPPQIAVAPRIINKLRLLGAEIAKVSPEYNMLPRNWRLLAAGDQHIDYFLVRDADGRISEREVAAVNDWLSAAEKNRSQTVIHCIRDHPKHTDQAIVDGLWGGRPRALYQVLRRNIIEMITDAVTLNTSSLSNDVNALLNEVIWPAASNFSYCHDSVSPCNRWTQLASRRPFPMTRHGQEYVGQKFDAHQELLNKDGYQIKTDVICVH